ncbi:hypothetical protein SAMN05421809_0080 [Natronorubrum daqingense]|uniref:Uncharacterized protein n=2 Tax=Natronorubrum daqingense TaxID=588898 RepID=A0A1N6XD75_9EURY|nr:hypothetical protein BB347_04755 [Natronorubrum daqingense]SIR00230.1 hypothetical protein SAMN05421809_0080 [Natronorubrum daqingense]
MDTVIGRETTLRDNSGSVSRTMSEDVSLGRFDDVSGYLRTLTWINLFLAAQLVVGLTYAAVVDANTPNVHYYFIPFIWITISALAVWYTRPVTRSFKYVAIAASVAIAYFLVILYLSGMVMPIRSIAEPGPSGLVVEWDRPLGWSPIVDYTGSWVSVRLIPYQVIGYLALSYLLYTAVLNISSSIYTGVVGLVTCPGCAAPVLAPLLAGAAGTSSAFVFMVNYTHEIATVLFVLAVGLLYWQPTLDEFSHAFSTRLRALTGGVAVAVAGLHLFHPTLGLPRLLEYVQLGTLYDPRPLLFTLSGLAIFVGIVLVATDFVDVPNRHLYALGIGLVLAYLIGYVAWHTVLEHGAFWPHIEAHGHHDQGVLETVVAHLLDDVHALASKTTEVVLLVLLVVLYRRER